MSEGFIARGISEKERDYSKNYLWVSRDAGLEKATKRVVMLVDTRLNFTQKEPKNIMGTLTYVVTTGDYEELLHKFSGMLLDDLNIFGEISDKSRYFLESRVKGYRKPKVQVVKSKEEKKEEHRKKVASAYVPKERRCKVCNGIMTGNSYTCRGCLAAGKKYCGTCNTVQPEIEFSMVYSGAKKGIRLSKCMECAKIAAKGYREKGVK